LSNNKTKKNGYKVKQTSIHHKQKNKKRNTFYMDYPTEIGKVLNA